MPKLKQPPRKLDATTELMHLAHAHWLAVGWLVARESGIEPPQSPLCGQVMEKWQNAKNLPAMLKSHKAEGQLLYRIRRLCLLLHDHPSAQICGGPEQWWQRVLEEDILSAICDHLAPEVMPEVSSIKPPTRAGTCWWLRRGVNPTNPVRRPATWALIEATQGRCYPSRVELSHPNEDVPLPVSALNGEMSLTRRKTLLKDLTGSINGWSLNHRIEITRDWLDVLAAWQLTAKDSPTNPKSVPVPVDQIEKYELLAPIIHNALMPTWWANQTDIFAALNDTLENKASHTNGFDGAEKIQQPALVDTQTPVRLLSATKKELRPGANPSQPLPLQTNLYGNSTPKRTTQVPRGTEP